MWQRVRRRLRDVNRYHVALAAMVSVLLGLVVLLSLPKICGPAEPGHMYCTVEETWAWLRSGGDWRLWTYLGVLALAFVGTLLPDDPPK